MPDSPVAFIIKSEASKQHQSVNETERKISGGAVNNTQGGKTVLFLMVAAALMIIAIVPGPAVLGMANGMNAKLVRSTAPSPDEDVSRG